MMQGWVMSISGPVEQIRGKKEFLLGSGMDDPSHSIFGIRVSSRGKVIRKMEK